MRQQGRGGVFRESHDSADYLDWSQARRVASPNLKPTTKHRHGGIACYDQDVFVNAVGGVRINEPTADLAG